MMIWEEKMKMMTRAEKEEEGNRRTKESEGHVCAKARHAMWQLHVVQHPNVAFGVDAHTLFDEARRENDAVHHRGAHHGAWVALAVLVDTHIGIEICLSCGSPVGSNHPDRTVLARSGVPSRSK